MNKIVIWSLLIGLVCFGTSCSTKKAGVSGAKQYYHNLTARNNGYYHANLFLHDNIKKLEDGYRDNFNEVLPLYRYAASTNVQSIEGQLDEVIQKCAVLAELHRISKWTDNAYFLMGKAEYIKKDYEKAAKTFRYTIANFDPDKPMSKMTKEEKAVAKSKLKKERKKNQKKKKKASAKKKRKKKAKKRKKKKRRKKSKKKKRRKKKRKKSSSKKKRVTKSSTDKKDAFAVETAPSETAKPTKSPVSNANANDDEEIVKRKRYFLKHKPVINDALIWLARTEIELQHYDEALSIIRKLEEDKQLRRRLLPEIQTVKAYAYLKQKQYSKAIEPLEKAIELTRRKRKKNRYQYILAQVYQLEGDFGKAEEAFAAVLKMRPTYEMEFNTNLNVIRNKIVGGGDLDEAKTALKRLVKDEKNEEYQDQIYFIMANLALKEDNKVEAIGYLKKSVALSRGNRGQKAESYWTLADLYYSDEQYVNASKYLDTTLTFMDKADERYPEVKLLSENIKDIAEQMEIVIWQDSMLVIAKMTKEEQKKVALQFKKANRKPVLAPTAGMAPSSRNRLAVESVARGGRENVVRRPPSTSANQSSWWAYNENSKRKGLRDFERKWGRRQYADNWRRKATQSANVSENEIANAGEQEAPLTEQEVIDILTKAGVPFNEKDAQFTNSKIMEALYSLGVLYRIKLDDNKKSGATLETLMRRYPKNKHELEAYFNMYLAFLEVDTRKATYYKDLLLKEYPDSKLAQSILDKNYQNADDLAKAKLVGYYEDAYSTFLDKNYQTALTKSMASDSLFGNQNDLKAKFALLSALSTGGVKGRKEYVQALKNVLASYPNSPEEAKARELLLQLGEGSSAQKGKTAPNKGKNNKPGKKGLFSSGKDSYHYVIVVLNDKKTRIDDVKKSISNYNTEFNKLRRLKISGLLLGINIPVITIRRFDNADAAIKYYEAAGKNEKFVDAEKYPFEMFVISQANYKVLLKSRKLEDYKSFFKEEYQ